MRQKEIQNSTVSEKARRYSSIRYSLAIFEAFFLAIFLFFFQLSGFSGVTASYLENAVQYHFIIPLYILVVYAFFYILNLPVSFYSSFMLEHKFGLSKQKAADWIKDELKGFVLLYAIMLILFEVFYFILKTSPQAWWFIVALAWIFFNLIFARLMPVMIIPLFFKYKPLGDENLRNRIKNLAENFNVKVLDVFEIDFSKKTLKANAAFVGCGRARRVILADTLKEKYSYDEIEAVLAHELAHYKLKHLIKLIIINSLVTLVTFFIIYKTSGSVLHFFGLFSLQEVSSMPVVLLYFILFAFVTAPAQNYASRVFERNADKMALEITGLNEAFVSTMEKLASQNLADRKPHPVIKFFFFDHPPIDERIEMAKKSV